MDFFQTMRVCVDFLWLCKKVNFLVDSLCDFKENHMSFISWSAGQRSEISPKHQPHKAKSHAGSHWGVEIDWNELLISTFARCPLSLQLLCWHWEKLTSTRNPLCHMLGFRLPWMPPSLKGWWLFAGKSSCCKVAFCHLVNPYFPKLETSERNHLYCVTGNIIS